MTWLQREREVAALCGRIALLMTGPTPYRVLGVERYRAGDAIVLRRLSDGLEIRAYWHEVLIQGAI